MKCSIPFVALLLCLAFISCENEPLGNELFNEDSTTDPTDPNDPSTPSDDFSLVGDWELVEFESSVNTTITTSGSPLPPIESEFEITSTAVDYSITFTETDFSASGDYAYSVEASAAGQELPPEEYTITDVSGSGNYTVNGNEITVDGQFFELTFEGGIDTSAPDEPQTSTFSFSEDGNTVTFVGSVTSEDNQLGIETVVSSTSTSVMQRVN